MERGPCRSCTSKKVALERYTSTQIIPWLLLMSVFVSLFICCQCRVGQRAAPPSPSAVDLISPPCLHGSFRYFIDHTIRAEQEDYETEGVEWEHVDYFNNKVR